MSRRAILALGLLAACLSPTGSSSAPIPALRFEGADISALERIEQAGGVFRDSGRVEDAITILRAHGTNTFRLRIFVNPNDSDVQVNNLAYTLRMAARIKASGAKLLLDFHYSDTWADPGHQATPAIWVGLTFDSLARRVETYTGSGRSSRGSSRRASRASATRWRLATQSASCSNTRKGAARAARNGSSTTCARTQSRMTCSA